MYIKSSWRAWAAHVSLNAAFCCNGRTFSIDHTRQSTIEIKFRSCSSDWIVGRMPIGDQEVASQLWVNRQGSTVVHGCHSIALRCSSAAAACWQASTGNVAAPAQKQKATAQRCCCSTSMAVSQQALVWLIRLASYCPEPIAS